MLSLLRDAPWLTERRVRAYAAILIAFDLFAIAWALTGSGINDPSGKPIGTDFVSFWTVSTALRHGEAAAIYQPLHLAALEQPLTGRGDLFYAWAYPPIALLLVAPLALLPYLWSLAAWLLFGLGVYLQALWRILPRGLALAAGLAFPAVFITIAHGQNALLSAGLMGTGLALLSAQPVAAGIAAPSLRLRRPLHSSPAQPPRCTASRPGRRFSRRCLSPMRCSIKASCPISSFSRSLPRPGSAARR